MNVQPNRTQVHVIHLALGLVALVVGLVVAFIGQNLIAAEHVHPICTGFIAIGVVATAVSLAERKTDGAPARTQNGDHRDRGDHIAD